MYVYDDALVTSTERTRRESENVLTPGPWPLSLFQKLSIQLLDALTFREVEPNYIY